MTNQGVLTLSESLVDELVRALGLPKNSVNHRIFWNLSRKITIRLARMGVSFDQILGVYGLPEASNWALTHFASGVRTVGEENIPRKGPVLILSNHPGSVDGLAIFSQLPRKDILWVSSYIPFFEHMPNVRKHALLTMKNDPRDQLLTLRKAIRHLNEGGILLYFAAGHMEPDPAVFPGSRQMMDEWLDGLEFFFRHVPNLQLMPTIVSGVVSPQWAESPVRYIRKKPIDQIRIVNFAQTIHQLLFPGSLLVTPSISFGIPMQKRNLNGETREYILAREKALLSAHCNFFGGRDDSVN